MNVRDKEKIRTNTEILVHAKWHCSRMEKANIRRGQQLLGWVQRKMATVMDWFIFHYYERYKCMAREGHIFIMIIWWLNFITIVFFVSFKLFSCIFSSFFFLPLSLSLLSLDHSQTQLVCLFIDSLLFASRIARCSYAFNRNENHMAVMDIWLPI